MAFTYTDTLLTDRDKVRFEIGDRVADHGPRPDSANFSDNEVGAVVTAEGSWQGAVVRLAGILANEWATAAGDVRMADYSENYTARAEYWRKRYQDLAKQFGVSTTSAQPSITRVDGFSNDITAEDV